MLRKHFPGLALTLSIVVLVFLSGVIPHAVAQWANRYHQVDGYSHHVYVEGFELPTLTNGPIDPAPAPDGRRLAFSSRGWLWVMDLETGEARRITAGGEMDFRPSWNPQGDRLAFVRDNDHDTRIVVIDAESGNELYTLDTPTIELDPVFSPDGRTLYYTSGESGDLDIWAFDFESEEERRITTDTGMEVKAQPHPNGEDLVVLSKVDVSDQNDSVQIRGDGGTGSPVNLVNGRIASMARPALSPDGEYLALNWPTQNGWELRLHRMDDPGPSVLLAEGLPLTPAWSPDGEWIYYSEADDEDRMFLKRIRAVGGAVEEVPVLSWDWEVDVARVRIKTRLTGRVEPLAVRLNVVDATGHPAVPDASAAHADLQSGRVFFYSPGVVEVSVPAGEVAVSAVRGLSTPEVTERVVARAGQVTEVELELESLWDARAAGWTSGDHHFHLNYGGQYVLSPEDLVPMMAGEDLDMTTPLLGNLHNRFEDQHLWGWEKSDRVPMIRFGQELRPHLLGHLGLIETPEFHWPWVWGPGYEVYGSDDRTNAEVLGWARDRGGLGFYVHPTTATDPFDEVARSGLIAELVADGVLGDLDALEVVCMWSDEVGTSAMWHRFLNLGMTVAPTAGTDVMTDYYRTMAIGTTRVYADTGDRVNWPAYIGALREGRSFVTNGPLLDFRLEEAKPGGVVEGGAADWSLELATATEVDTVELIVNGNVVWSDEGLDRPGRRSYSGTVQLPDGGWVGIRASGGETRWPSMDSYPFAHTAPVWIDHRGSFDEAARRTAAGELLQVLDASQNRLVEAYGDAEIPRLLQHFDAARTRLTALGAGN